MTSDRPPPVPRAAARRTPVVSGGRRRRSRRGAAIALLVLAPLAVAAAAYFSFGVDDGSSGTGATPLAAGSPPIPRAADQPHEQGPYTRSERVPNVSLGGVDAFHVDLRRPPRAGLVFDVRTGDVLWRREPLKRVPMASLT